MNRRWLALALAALGVFAPAVHAASPSASGSAAKLGSKLAKIASTVNAHFAGQQDFQPSDLIRRSDGAAIFDKLAVAGWKPAERDQVLARMPADGDFLAQLLKPPDGKKFMRQIAKYPGGYDRLDHLSRLPRGERMARDLVRGPDGYKMIEYMATSSGGRELGKMLSETPDGSGFNQPTGRIYTAGQLTAELQQLYIRTH